MDVVETSVAGLLGDVRSVPTGQQTRLGFSDVDRCGMRVWCAGDTSLLRRRSVAIVGTRKVSSEGAARARRLARELVAHGVVVVSGLAYGVDSEATRAAMAADGKVVAVIGTPIDAASPLENAAMQEAIYKNHLLVSQFPVGRPVSKGNFPARNKLMAALTDATVVIEASDTSGTIHQAAECVRLGRWLFIAKSLADDPRITWTDSFLCGERARPMSSTHDVLDALGIRLAA